MTLDELCEPVFQEVCRLNRLVRKGGGSAAELNRSLASIRSIFEKMKGAASTDFGLLNQYLKVEKPLVYFVDFMVSESKLPWAGEWPSLEREKFGTVVGELAFFELLDETLADQSPGATEQLEIFYKCIGLGFTGFYADQPQVLRRKMLEIQNRLKDAVDLDSATQFVPENERCVNKSNIYVPPGRGLVVMSIVLVGLIILLFVFTYFMFVGEKDDLQAHLEAITQSCEKVVNSDR